MTLAKLYSKVFKPKNKDLSIARELVNMYEKDIEAVELLKRIDNLESYTHIQYKYEQRYEDMLNEIIAYYNNGTFKVLRFNYSMHDWGYIYFTISLVNETKLSIKFRYTPEMGLSELNTLREAACREFITKLTIIGMKINSKTSEFCSQ